MEKNKTKSNDIANYYGGIEVIWRDTMQNVEVQTDNLVKAIQESEEYIRYKSVEEALSEQKELWNKVNEFRRNKFFVQMKQGENFLEENDKIKSDYDTLLHNGLVEDSLVAEQQLCKLMRKINARIFDSIDMNIDFLEG